MRKRLFAVALVLGLLVGIAPVAGAAPVEYDNFLAFSAASSVAQPGDELAYTGPGGTYSGPLLIPIGVTVYFRAGGVFCLNGMWDIFGTLYVESDLAVRAVFGDQPIVNANVAFIEDNVEYANYFTVTLDPAGGTLNGRRTINFWPGLYDVNFKNPTSPAGEPFLGWYDGDVRVTDTTMLSGNVTLVARYGPAPEPPTEPPTDADTDTDTDDATEPDTDREPMTDDPGLMRIGGSRGPEDQLDRPMGQAGFVIGNATAYDGAGTKNPVAGTAAAGSPLRLLQWNGDGTWCKVIFVNAATGVETLGWMKAAHIGV